MSRAKNVVITGATSGIGSAVAKAFAANGDKVFLVGRNQRKLSNYAKKIPPDLFLGTGLADLGSADAVDSLATTVERQIRKLDVIVHCAGVHESTALGVADAITFDSLFSVNVRGPYLLTQRLADRLASSKGQVLIVNSSVVRNFGAGVAVFKATQHALQGLADSLRQDFNKRDVRVSSIYPGQTSTPRLKRIYKQKKEPYDPKALLRASDVAELIVGLTNLPRRIEVTDVHARSAIPY